MDHVPGDPAKWLYPLAELTDSVLMLEFPDITQRDRILRGGSGPAQDARLVLVAGMIPHDLKATFRLRSATALSVVAQGDCLLLASREDSRRCVVLR